MLYSVPFDCFQTIQNEQAIIEDGEISTVGVYAVFDSSVVSLTVVIDFWGYADLDLTATRGQFDPKGSLVLPLLNRDTCHLFVLHAIYF